MSDKKLTLATNLIKGGSNEMPLPCEQKEVIEEIKKEQTNIRDDLKDSKKQNEKILTNQEIHADEFRTSIDKLTEVLMQNVKHDGDIDRLKKDVNILFKVKENLSKRVDQVERDKALFEGAEIFKKVKVHETFFQQEKGWRRFIPAAMTFLACLSALASFFLTQHDKILP